MKTVDVNIAIDYLNSLLLLDRDAVTALVMHRVPCNEKIINNPEIQTLTEDGVSSVGLLGILNGLFGLDEDNRPFIVAEVNYDDNKIEKFIHIKDKPVDK